MNFRRNDSKKACLALNLIIPPARDSELNMWINLSHDPKIPTKFPGS